MTALTVRALFLAACTVAASTAFLPANTNTRPHAMPPPPAYRTRSGPTCNLDRKGRASGWHNPFSNKDSRHLELLDIPHTVINRQPPPTRGVGSDGGGGGGGGAPKMNSTFEENMAAEMNLGDLLDILEELLDLLEQISRALTQWRTMVR